METNQIAEAAQRGEADLLELWEAVWRFAHDRAYRWARATEGRAGTELEDFMQVAFIAVVDALGSWKPEKGSFISWYNLRLKSAFTEATGQRTQRDKRDPLQNCVSLDMPINGIEGGALTLGDTLPDPAAEQAIENVAERDYLQRRHGALSQALQDLSESQRRTVVLRICYGLTLEEAAERLGAPQEEVMANERMGLRLLRHPSIASTLKPYL